MILRNYKFFISKKKGGEGGITTIAGPGAEAAAKQAVEQNKKVISKIAHHKQNN